ncbi:MAG: SusD/RagB family nutrient-binding outer membrane lipoprotein [Flavobacteriaceae bacterium]|nr:SusD/RagB family nutrient-binding outer membrane lipoprotein [Flavobacteriaceae bacterium]
MKLFKSLLVLLVSITIFSCTDDFDEINTDPNTPVVVGQDLLLASVTSDLPNALVRIGWNQGNITAQIAAKNNFVDQDVYQWGTSGAWSGFYGILAEVEDIIALSRAEGTKNPSYEAVGLIAKSLIYANLTDMYNAIPYSEAFKGKTTENFTPAYDDQETVYQGILAELETAVSLLDQNQPLRGGDLIYEGNTSNWKKLANSLRLRYLLRTSKQNDVAAQMEAIVAAGDIFTSNADNAVLTYQGNSNIDSWYMSTARIGSFDEYSLTNTVFNFMDPLNDPRLPLWYDVHPDSGNYGPMPNGLSQDNARTFDSNNDVSRFDLDHFWKSNTAVEAPLMKYSELQFILAEAHQRGFISTGSAAIYYENGIRATMSYWGVADADIDTYMEQAAVGYDGTLNQIMEQKRLANFMVGMETWFDFRRTGLPTITPGPDNVNGDRVPVRYLYPDEEKSLNKTNYDAAVSTIGGDDLNAKGWWETGSRY